jgi:predicted TPR repeat methyltransferase
VFCWPVPSSISDEYSDVVDEEYLRHRDSRVFAASACLDTITRYVSTGRLLDVGCATGDFLAVARDRHYVAEGLELSAWSASIARGRGLTIYDQPLVSLAEQMPGAFDVATLWGVIEHFAHPADEMARLASLLKPGGLLALWTGDVDSITSRLLGRRWWYWQGQHIQYFSKRSMQRLVRDVGLEMVGIRLYPFGATHQTISNSLGRYVLGPLIEPILTLPFRLRPAWHLLLPGEMFVLARRRAA